MNRIINIEGGLNEFFYKTLYRRSENSMQLSLVAIGVIDLSYRITVPELNIGGHIVKAPEGLSELLEKCWTTKTVNDGVLDFVSKYNRSVFRNSKGQLVSRYVEK